MRPNGWAVAPDTLRSMEEVVKRIRLNPPQSKYGQEVQIYQRWQHWIKASENSKTKLIVPFGSTEVQTRVDDNWKASSTNC